jgi:Rrf2 family nitric oxide-sensitive transcriptional repressor
MVFSHTAEYALRAVVWLASRPGEPQTTRQIAHGTKVPGGYLSKVLQALARGGVVSSQRGLHGGFILSADPKATSVLDVVNIVDPVERIRTCPLGIESHGTTLCRLHSRLDTAIAQVEAAFAASTLAELTSDGPTGQPLCAEPDR